MRALLLRCALLLSKVCHQVHATALAAAGITTLDALEAANPRHLEAVAGRSYPCAPACLHALSAVS